MLRKALQYSLVSLVVWGFVGCSERTIIVPAQTPSQRVELPPVKKEPPIKEEILLGRNTQNPNLGTRVDVPENNPSLGEMISGEYRDENSTEYSETSPQLSEIIERMPFPVEEYKRLKKRGYSTVSGRIYVVNSYNSESVPARKVKLWLNPVTSYSRQWYQESYLGGYRLSKADKRLYNYLKFTYSDNDGNFNFYGVPRGDYYLVGTMKCSIECGFPEEKSIRLVREISVGKGTTTVNLTKPVP